MSWKELFRRRSPVEVRLADLRSAIRATIGRERTTDDYERLEQLAFRVAELGEPAVEPLCEALGDPDDAMRQYACIALTKAPNVEARVKALVAAASRSPLGPVRETTDGVVAFGEEALDPLLRELESDNRDVRGRVTDAIAGLGAGVVGRLIVALRNPNPLARAATASALATIGDRKATPHLILLLSDEAETVRERAAYGFRELRDPAAVQPLKAALEDDANGFAVKGAAVGSLRALGWTPETENQQILAAVIDLDPLRGKGWSSDRIGAVTRFGPAAVDHLVMALDTARDSVQRDAAEALGMIGNPRALEPLGRALGYRGWDVAKAAGAALVELGPEGIRRLTVVLRGEDSEARLHSASALEGAAKALRKAWDTQAVEPLIEALNDKEPWVRRKAVFALADLGDARAAQGIVQALSDTHPDVMDAANRSLEHLGETDLSRAVVDPLIGMLVNDRAVIRVRAVQNLGLIGDPRAVAPLAEIVLKDPERGIRRTAAVALGAIGGEHAVQSLRAAAGDDDSDVRRAAAESLRKLGKS